MFTIILISLLSSMFGVGCYPCRNITTTQRDSTYVELQPRQIALYDTVHFDIISHTEKAVAHTDSSFLENPYATTTAIILPTGELHHTLESKPQTIAVEYRTEVEVRDSIIYKSRTETKIVEVEKRLTSWQRVQIRGFWLLVTMLSGAIFLRRFF